MGGAILKDSRRQSFSYGRLLYLGQPGKQAVSSGSGEIQISPLLGAEADLPRASDT